MAKLRLDSWKSIADYLERSARTVQRWHACHGLPVHHFGGCKGSVFAYADEIDRWLVGLAEETRAADDNAGHPGDARKRTSLELTTRALQMWESHSEDNLGAVACLFRKAIEQDPANPRAFTGLANTMISAALEGAMDTAVAYPCAAEALRRVAQIAPQDIEARCTAAWLSLVYHRNWRQARDGFLQVLSQQPQRPFALAGMALLHIAEGDLESASHCGWEAWMQNALVCSLGTLVCWSKYLQGDKEQALELVAQTRGCGGGGAMIGTVEALLLLQSGPMTANIRRIESIAAEFPHSQALQGALGHSYAISGQSGKAVKLLHSLEESRAQNKPNNAYAHALVLTGLGSGREAIQWLEAAFDDGSLWSLGFRTDPVLQQLQGEPRFDALLRKIGSPGLRGIPVDRALPFIANAAASSPGHRSHRGLAIL